jgi:formylmethanofuran dehydrogenase subunit B
MFTTTPNEARVRSDFILLIGPGLSSYWPALYDRLALSKTPRLGGHPTRRIVWIGPRRDEAKREGLPIETYPAAPEEVPDVVAALRARLGGRPIAATPAGLKKVDALVEGLRAARFGVAVWAAAGLDPLSVEMLQGLVTDLNAASRFTGIPIGARADASGVIQVSGWTTGFPPRTGFGRGYPEHDPWRFEAKRLIESREADAALWISAYDGEPPPWSRADVPLVTLAPASAKAAAKRGVFIEVGRPGEDYDCVEFAQETSTLAWRRAKTPSSLPSVAEAIGAISARFSEDVPC